MIIVVTGMVEIDKKAYLADVMPTCAAIAETKAKNIDGINILPTLE